MLCVSQSLVSVCNVPFCNENLTSTWWNLLAIFHWLAPGQVPSLPEVVGGHDEEDEIRSLDDDDREVEVDEGGQRVGEEAAPLTELGPEDLDRQFREKFDPGRDGGDGRRAADGVDGVAL